MDEMEITFPGGLRVDASFGDFVVQTDQPPDTGGEASAPKPFDLFLASIATCAGIYILSFCRQRNIPTEDIRLVQRAQRDPETNMIASINLDIYLPSDFPARYVEAVVRTASLCSVKKHLANPPEFYIEPRVGMPE
jgi:ribosomal protein S12 methylthiotransferase accessory factor